MCRKNQYRWMFADNIHWSEAKDADPYHRLWVVNNTKSSGSGTAPATIVSKNSYTYGLLDETKVFNAIANAIGAGINNKNVRFTRTKVSLSHEITNTTSADIMVTEMRFKCLRDMPQDVLCPIVGTGFTYAGSGVGSGLIDGTFYGVGTIYNSFSLPGDYSPAQNMKLRKFARLVGQKTIRLQPGSSHTFKYSDSRLHKVDCEILLDASGLPYDALRGSEFTVFGFGGTAVVNQSAVENYQVGISPVSASVITRGVIDYTWIDDVTLSMGHQLAQVGATAGGGYYAAHAVVENYPQSVLVPPSGAVATLNYPTSFAMEKPYAGATPAGDVQGGAAMEQDI